MRKLITQKLPSMQSVKYLLFPTKCIFQIYFQLYFNKTLHAYVKQRLNSFVEVAWVKIEKSTFEIFHRSFMNTAPDRLWWRNEESYFSKHFLNAPLIYKSDSIYYKTKKA